MATNEAIKNLDDLLASKRATISAQEAAAVLGCDRRTVIAGVESKAIKGLRLGRLTLVSRTPLLEALGLTDAA